MVHSNNHNPSIVEPATLSLAIRFTRTNKASPDANLFVDLLWAGTTLIMRTGNILGPIVRNPNIETGVLWQDIAKTKTVDVAAEKMWEECISLTAAGWHPEYGQIKQIPADQTPELLLNAWEAQARLKYRRTPERKHTSKPVTTPLEGRDLLLRLTSLEMDGKELLQHSSSTEAPFLKRWTTKHPNTTETVKVFTALNETH